MNKNHNYPICKIEILDKNDKIIGEIPQEDIISGSTTFTSQFAIRRTADIMLNNSHSKYIPTYRSDFIWLDKKFKIYSGRKINGLDTWVCRGIYVVTEVQTVNESGVNIYVNLTLNDLFALLNGEISGTLENTYVIPVSTYIHTAIRAILTSAGITKYPIINCDNIQTYYTITQEAGNTYSNILEELAKMVSADCYFDKNGYLRFQTASVNELTDISSKPSVYDFNSNDVEYISNNHRYSFDSVRNYIQVISENTTGSQIQAFAEDTNIFSPYRTSLIGKRIEVVDNSNAYTTELCQIYANWMLWKKAIINESIDITISPIDELEEGQVISIQDESVGIDHQRFLINSINFPLLGNGTSSLSCWKIRNFN